MLDFIISQKVIYSCDGPSSFRNHCYMIWCSRNIFYYNQCWKRFKPYCL